MDKYIKRIYKIITGIIPFSDVEKKEYKELYDTYSKDPSKHLFIDDFENRTLECLTEEKMCEKFHSGKHLDSGMLDANNTNDIKKIKYIDFYIYMEVKALIYLGENLNTITKILTERYSKAYNNI